MKSIRQIANESNITHATIAKRVEMLKCIPIKKIWRSNYYDKDDVKRILEYKRDYVSDKKRLLVVEYYLTFNYLTAEALSNILSIKKEVVRKIINDFLQNDNCIIIQSKL